MGFGESFRFRVASLFRSNRLEDDMDQEMRAHFDQLVDDFKAEGHDNEKARRLAHQQFGNIDLTKEQCRDSWGSRIVFDFWRDISFAKRQLMANKSFASICIATIAIAIGASTTIFSVVDAVLLRPLPYGSPDQIVSIWEVSKFGRNSVSGGAFLDWKNRSTLLDSAVLSASVTQNLQLPSGPVRVSGMEATADFLDVLQVTPIKGRGFLPNEDKAGASPVVILTEEIWSQRFEADEAIIGSIIVLDEIARQVVGILPKNTWIGTDVEFFIPANLEQGPPFRAQRASHWANVYGRLKPNIAPEQLDAELKAIKTSLNAEYPQFKKDWSVEVAPLHELIKENSKATLGALGTASIFLLLIACANVANLLLARGTHRQGELSMRVALGASNGRIFRQALSESLLLATIGSSIGILLAYLGIHLMRIFNEGVFPGAMTPALDIRVLGASIIISAAAALFFGIWPAWKACRARPQKVLRDNTQSIAGARSKSQSTLVIAEVALTVVLLFSTGLLLKSLVNKMSEDPGYNVHNTHTFEITLPGSVYGGAPKRIEYTRKLLEAIKETPGIISAGSLSASPLGDGARGEFVSRQDQPDTRNDFLASAIYVGGSFFQTMEARLAKGRFFEDRDNQSKAARSIIVDRAIYETLYSDGEEAVGQFLNMYNQQWRIVGIIDPMNLDPNPRSAGYVYLPHQYDPFRISIVAKSKVASASQLPLLRDAVASIDSKVPMANVRTLADALDRSLSDRKFTLTLVGAFTVIALTLASVGLYGVISYTTARRQRELSIRRSLGATKGKIISLITFDGGRLTFIGLAIGLILSIAATRLIASQLYEVSRYDPIVLVGTLLIFAFVSLLACWAPALRAVQIDPAKGLRAD